jgi:hypothetical protein
MQTTTEFQLEPIPAPLQVLRDLGDQAPTMAQTFTLLYACKNCRIARVRFDNLSWFNTADATTPREILIMAEGPRNHLLVTLWADNGLLGTLLALGFSDDRSICATRLYQWHTHRPPNEVIVALFDHAFDGGLDRLP